MFGLSHLQFYDLQNLHDRNIFKLGTNSILGKLIKSSELFYTDERNVNGIAMNLTTNEQNNPNGCSSGNSSSKNSPIATKNNSQRNSANGHHPRHNRNHSNGSNHSNSNGKSNDINGNNHGSNNTNNLVSCMKNRNGSSSSCNSNGNSNDILNGHQDIYQKTTNMLTASDLNSPVDSAKINNDLSEVNANTTTINTNSLKRLTGITKQNFDMQKKKYLKVISFLNQHNHHLELELAKEKRRRAEELSKIIKSLLCFEAKLKHDKKVINQKLHDKDTEISRLITLNRVLRKKYTAVTEALGGDTSDEIDDSLCSLEEEDFPPQQCPKCRKDFYEIVGKDVWTQTFTDGRSSIEDHTENGSSSDETVSSSFYGARRSVRYTSKRNFREYMRSRCMAIDDPSLENSEENVSGRDGADSNDNNSTIYEKTNAFSRKIERLHGVRRIESFTDEAELDSENDSTRLMNRRRGGGGGSGGCKSQLSSINGSGDCESDEMFMPVKTRTYRAKKFAETSPKQEFEASTDDWYASASDLDDSENIRVKPYGYNAVNPVLECVNQILLQQSMDECIMDGPPSLESSENNSGSSGGGSSQQEGRTGSRKRVHFSIKNSMVHVPRDDRMGPMTSSPLKCVIDSNDQKDCNLNYESIYSNEYERIGSEHNSSNLYVDMESKFGQEDRMMTATPLSDKPPKKPPALPPKPANLMKFKRVLKITPYCPDSIKEDEPKIPEEDHQRNGDNDSEEPDYCSISEVNEAITSVQIVADVHKSADSDASSHISDSALSQKTDEAEEIFADVPKLPNVAAIIVPKSINKTTATENHAPKEPPNSLPLKTIQIPNILAEINKKMTTSNVSANHLTPTTPSKVASLPPIINCSPSKLFPPPPPPAVKLPSTPTTPHNIPPPEPDKLPLQAEFDWYNLDAEYGKSNQPDVIKETDNNANLEYHQMMMVTVNEENEENDEEAVQGIVNQNGSVLDTAEQSIEYKLDEEFCLTNQPDIIKENVFETSTRSKNKSKTVCNGFPTVVDESPCNNVRGGVGGGCVAGGGGGGSERRVKINRKNFKNFMDASGLSTKPLPRQRKIYFSGPFV